MKSLKLFFFVRMYVLIHIKSVTAPDTIKRHFVTNYQSINGIRPVKNKLFLSRLSIVCL